MKKLLYILLFISFNSFSQDGEFNDLYVRNFIRLSDSTVTNISTGDTLTTNEFLRAYLLDYTTLDSLSYYMLTTDIRQEISDSISSYNSPSFGTDGQIPFMNTGGTDLQYSSDFRWFNSLGYFRLGYSTINDYMQLEEDGLLLYNTSAGIHFRTNGAADSYQARINGIPTTTTGNIFEIAYQDNEIAKFDPDTVRIFNNLQIDSTLYALHQVQVAVKDCTIIPSTDWVTIKYDTLFTDYSTSAFKFNDDSTGIVCLKDMLLKMSGKAILTNNTAGNVIANIKLVLQRNSEQVSKITTSVTRPWAAYGSSTLIAPSFSFNVNKNDTLYATGKFGSTDINLDYPDEDIQPQYPFILEFTENPLKKE